MNHSKVENDFISWCQYIHPDINPYIFIRRHTRYSEEYFPFLEDLMTEFHHELSKKLPNINFSFKGRVKSKRSFFIKSFRTMSESIEKLFPDKSSDDEEALKETLAKRDENIEKYFRFLLKNNETDRFNEIKSMIENTPHELGTLDGFRHIFEQLSPEEKENLVTRLGRTEDTFANRVIVNSVDFDIQSFEKSPNGQIEIITKNKETIPLSSSLTISPSQIVDENGTKFVTINGMKKEITEGNLLYPRDLPASKRTFENALRTADGRIILLQDSIVIDGKEHFDVVSVQATPITGDVLLYNQYGESKNLSLLLSTSHNVKLRKTDSEYTEPSLYQVRDIMYDFYNNNDITRIGTRSKDYVATPKEGTNYKSLHDSFFYGLLGYSLETQIRDLEMERQCENPKIKEEQENTDALQPTFSPSAGHDKYKKQKLKKWYSNPILRSILEKDLQAFDSSTEVLEELAYDPNVELPDLLGKYILVTRFPNGESKCYIPEINYVFEHTFGNVHDTVHDPDDPLPLLDFSSYKNFIKSRKIRNDAKSKGNSDIDFDL